MTPMIQQSTIRSLRDMSLDVGADRSVDEKEETTIGFALFGSGIRGASFSSGVLGSAVRKHGENTRFVVSAVSGGGFVGSAFCQRVAIQRRNERKNSGQQRSRRDIYEALDSDMEKNIGYCVDFSRPRLLFDLLAILSLLVSQIVLIVLTIMPFIVFLVEMIASFHFYAGDDRVWLVALAGAVATVGLLVLSQLLRLPPLNRFTFPARIFSWLKVLTFLCALFTVLVGSQLAMDGIEKALGTTGASILGGSLMGLWAIIRFHPLFFIEAKIEGIINSLTGYVAMLAIYGLFINWRLVGEKPDNYLFDHLLFTERTWTILLAVSLGLIALFPVINGIASNHIHYYYRWRLQRAFYEGPQGERLRRGCDGMPGCTSGMTFGELEDDTSYIATMTASLWATSAASPSSAALSVGKRIHGVDTSNSIGYLRTEIGGTDTVVSAGQLHDMELSFAMVNSGASLTSTFGSDTKFASYEHFFALFNLGVGSWTNGRPGTRSWRATVVRDIGAAFLAADFGGNHWASPIQSPIVRIFRQSLGIPIIEKEAGFMYLSDGSHSENSALFVLLQDPTVKRIYMADGSEDVGRTCSDLKKVMHMARACGWRFSGVVGVGNDGRRRENWTDVEEMLIGIERDETKRSIDIYAWREDDSSNGVTIHYLKPSAGSDDAPSGIACNCCHNSPSLLRYLYDFMFGKFPNTSSYYQLFTPRLYTAYKNEGIKAFNSATNWQEIA
eukprot:gene6103-7070_t